MSKKAAVLWTGGKDSSLALYEAKLLGHEVRSLVTFVPSEPEFLAHPLSFVKSQAEALGLSHYALEVNEPFKASYANAIYSLQERHEIDTLITGDIAEVDGHPNWIRECSEYSGVNVLTPLWGCDRLELLGRLLSYRFRVIFSCVKKPWFTVEWVGEELNKDTLEDLCNLSVEKGFDVCGEQGEYHTLVLDGPLFQKTIHIDGYSKEAKDSLMYMSIEKMSLRDKKEFRSWQASTLKSLWEIRS